MDNDQQAAILALIVTALKIVREARRVGDGVAPGTLIGALESDAINALEAVREVSH